MHAGPHRSLQAMFPSLTDADLEAVVPLKAGEVRCMPANPVASCAARFTPRQPHVMQVCSIKLAAPRREVITTGTLSCWLLAETETETEQEAVGTEKPSAECRISSVGYSFWQLSGCSRLLPAQLQWMGSPLCWTSVARATCAPLCWACGGCDAISPPCCVPHHAAAAAWHSCLH
jgi:hypothetical protein